jgi:hypothetical protein
LAKGQKGKQGLRDVQKVDTKWYLYHVSILGGCGTQIGIHFKPKPAPSIKQPSRSIQDNDEDDLFNDKDFRDNV